jgi:hypothetical protein
VFVDGLASQLVDIKDGPDPVAHVPESVYEEDAVLHALVPLVKSAELEVADPAEKHGGPENPHDVVDRREPGRYGARL